MNWEMCVGWLMSALTIQALAVGTAAIAAVALCLCGASAIRGRLIFATLFAGLGIANGFASMNLHRLDGNGTPRQAVLLEQEMPYELLGVSRYDEHRKIMVGTMRNTRTGEIQDWDASKAPNLSANFQIHPTTGTKTIKVFASPPSQ